MNTDAKPVSGPYAKWKGEQCPHCAEEGSLAWGNRCILRRHKEGAHVYGTPAWEREIVGSRALADVVQERIRQVADEGWTAEHDDAHGDDSMAIAAACYALPPGMRQMTELGCPWGWPWDPSWWKPKGSRRDKVRAAALIIADIDRMDRLEATP